MVPRPLQKLGGDSSSLPPPPYWCPYKVVANFERLSQGMEPGFEPGEQSLKPKTSYENKN